MYYDADYVRALEYGMPPAGGTRLGHRPDGDVLHRRALDPRRAAVPAHAPGAVAIRRSGRCSRRSAYSIPGSAASRCCASCAARCPARISSIWAIPRACPTAPRARTPSRATRCNAPRLWSRAASAAWWSPATPPRRRRSARCAQRHPAIPVIGVIEPGAAAAVAASRSRHIAVIGTEGTIGGGAYQAAIRRLDPQARVTAAACSLFVALAEEGWTRARSVEASRTATSIRCSAGADPPDTLVLGCTHFPCCGGDPRGVAAAGRDRRFGRDHGRGGAREGRRSRARVRGGDLRWLATDDAAALCKRRRPIPRRAVAGASTSRSSTSACAGRATDIDCIGSAPAPRRAHSRRLCNGACRIGTTCSLPRSGKIVPDLLHVKHTRG